jgi:ligand-binding SRPBCC domain-containing protein
MSSFHTGKPTEIHYQALPANPLVMENKIAEKPVVHSKKETGEVFNPLSWSLNNSPTHQLTIRQKLPITIGQAWEFFSTPRNLSRITPPDLDFRILTPDIGDQIYNGMLIDYRVKPLFGIAMKWTTEIVNVSPYQFFTDRQMKGPYKKWEHTHYFQELEDGILMTDVVNYQLPFGRIGRLFHWLWIQSKIEYIFNYRMNTLNKIFPA